MADSILIEPASYLLNKLSVRERVILLVFVRYGALSKYELHQRFKEASYSSIYNSIKKLLKFNFIYIYKTLPSEKNVSIEVDYYKLSKEGLSYLLFSYHVEETLSIITGESEKLDTLYNYIYSMAQGVLINYSEYLPSDLYPEMLEFSEQFGALIIMDYLLAKLTLYPWAYLTMNDNSSSFNYENYINIIEDKIKGVKNKQTELYLHVMNDNDLKILINFVRKILEHTHQTGKELIKSSTEQLKRIKNLTTTQSLDIE